MLDLSTVIEVPGASVRFERELDTKGMSFPAVLLFTEAPKAVGSVYNSAGALTLTGTLTMKMRCLCDRCLAEFDEEKVLPLKLLLSAELQDEDNPDIFPLDGDSLDIDFALETCLILDMEAKRLCRADCAGLCERCGANLNEGGCSCGREVDPRLQKLTRLLSENEE